MSAKGKGTNRGRRFVLVIYWTLRSIVLVILVHSLIRARYENAATCLLTLGLFFLPSLAERKLRIALPDTLEVMLLLFIFAAEILGELSAWYVRVAGWDTMLHAINGFLFAAIGFSLADLLNREEDIQFTLSPFFLSLVAFSFSMTIGVLWEFFEFGMDRLFLFDMQKDTVIHSFSSVMLDPLNQNRAVAVEEITSVSVNGNSLPVVGYLDIGLIDTMKDLLVNFIGAIAFSMLGYFYTQKQGRGKLARHFIPVVLRKKRKG